MHLHQCTNEGFWHRKSMQLRLAYLSMHWEGVGALWISSHMQGSGGLWKGEMGYGWKETPCFKLWKWRIVKKRIVLLFAWGIKSEAELNSHQGGKPKLRLGLYHYRMKLGIHSLECYNIQKHSQCSENWSIRENSKLAFHLQDFFL